MPQWYTKKPLIYPIDTFYLRAFYDLSTCRDSGFGIGPIPWTAIVKYIEFYNLDPDLAEPFIDIIREMDVAYIKYQTAEQERNRKMQEKKSSRKQ